MSRLQPKVRVFNHVYGRDASSDPILNELVQELEDLKDRKKWDRVEAKQREIAAYKKAEAAHQAGLSREREQRKKHERDRARDRAPRVKIINHRTGSRDSEAQNIVRNKLQEVSRLASTLANMVTSRTDPTIERALVTACTSFLESAPRKL